jgi:aerobic-type carbon monoxide dehydrogenase small subunit (CoxS/CutS family)
MHIDLTINGELHAIDTPADRSLLSVLRDDLGLTGARFGCGHGVCGACVVLIEGRPLPSCSTSAAEAAGRPIVTIEGLAPYDHLHPVQAAFLAEDAIQCGYCTSGLILSAVALLSRSRRPSDSEIREALAPHLCRCGVYQRVLRAVKRAAA